MRHPHILFLLLLGALALHGTSPSFDCTRATHSVEKRICASPTLSSLDTKLTQTYTQLRHRVQNVSDPSINHALVQEQKKWLTQRNRCRNTPCLLRQYHERQRRLEDWTYARRKGRDPFAGTYYRFETAYGELAIHPLGQGRYTYHYFLTLNNSSMTHVTDEGNATLDPSQPDTLLADGIKSFEFSISRYDSILTLSGDMLGDFDGFTFVDSPEDAFLLESIVPPSPEKKRILFAFTTRQGKRMTLLAGADGSWLLYRYGRDGHIEMEYPRHKKGSLTHFTRSHYFRGGGAANLGLELDSLTFTRGEYTYEVYSNYSAEEGKRSVGIRVWKSDQGSDTATNIPGIPSTLEGSLSDLGSLDIRRN